MHGRHIEQPKRLHIIFGCVIHPLLADHACNGVTPSKWHTETARGVAVDHDDDVAQARTLSKRIKEAAFALVDPTSY